MKKWDKTRIVLIIFSLLVIIVAFYVQVKGQEKVSKNCSYLDPITIDILAFLAALFLVVEGIYRIYTHKKDSLKRQSTRIIRIGFGFAILTIHTIQFIHK